MTILMYVLDADGVPQQVTSPEQHAVWLEHADRQVRWNRVGRAVVSTVFLGVAVTFRERPGWQPRLWETMVFQPYQNRPDEWWAPDAHKRGIFDGLQFRYPSQAAAIDGHATVVQAIERYRHGSRRYRKQIKKGLALRWSLVTKR